MATTMRLVTAEDLELLPKGQSGDLIRGVIQVSPVGNPHWRLTGKLNLRVGGFVEEHGLGEVGPAGGFILGRDPDVVLGPDLAFVRADRLPPLATRGFLPFAPDLAVEILSSDNTARQVAEKVALYLAADTRLVWVVDAEGRTFGVHPLGERARTRGIGETLDGGEVLPGFALPLAELFV